MLVGLEINPEPNGFKKKKKRINSNVIEKQTKKPINYLICSLFKFFSHSLQKFLMQRKNLIKFIQFENFVNLK